MMPQTAHTIAVGVVTQGPGLRSGPAIFNWNYCTKKHVASLFGGDVVAAVWGLIYWPIAVDKFLVLAYTQVD